MTLQNALTLAVKKSKVVKQRNSGKVKFSRIIIITSANCQVKL